MGQKNNVLNSYMSKPERIQSVLEYYIGEKLPVDWATRCEEVSGFYTIVNSKGKVTFRQRDILKRIKTDSGSYLLGIENQENINLIFPWRLMQMDCLAYEKQIEEIQDTNKVKSVTYEKGDDYLYHYKAEDDLEPVVNLMLYWGKRKWKKPLGIKDMVKLSEIPPKITGMFMDYGVHMIDMRSIPDEALKEMDSDLKYVLGIMKCGNSEEEYAEYIKKHEDFFGRIPKSAADVINVCMNIGRINEMLEYIQTEDGEECADMCKAVDDMIKNSEERGRQQGRHEGENRMAQLNKLLIGANRIADLAKASEDVKYRRRLYKEFGLVN